MTGYDASPAREDFHGFHLSPQQELLLRGAVPERALRWAAAAVGGGARVCGSEALVGGTTSAVHALTVAGGDGRLAP